MPPSSNFPDNTNNAQATPPAQPQQFQTPPPAQSVAPQGVNGVPVYDIPTSSPRRIKLIVGIILAIIIIGGGITLAATGVISIPIPFLSKAAPYENAHIIKGISDGISKIKTSSYVVSFGVRSNPRDPDAVSFDKAVAEDPNLTAMLNRDQDRARDIGSINTTLREYYYKNKVYPSSLAAAGIINTKDGNGVGYLYATTKNGKGFTLSVTFETAEAVASINRYDTQTKVENKTAVFTESSYNLYFNLDSQKPTFLGLRSSDFQSIPSEFSFDMNFIGATAQKGKVTNGKLSADANFKMGDMKVEAQAEMRKISNDFYFQINKFPSFFGNFDMLKTKWIKLSPSDLSQLGYGMDYTDADSAQKDFDGKKEKAVEQMKLFLSVADKHQAIKVKTGPVKESVDKVTAYRYDIGFNKDTMVAFYKDLTDTFSAKYTKDSPIQFDQSILDQLQSSSFSQTFDYLDKNIKMSIWADADGIPVKYLVDFRLVPPTVSAKDAGKQINLVVSVTLKDINKSITIDTPAGAMSYEDAYILMSGKTKDQIKYEKQKQSVSTLRSALENYKYANKKYPASLDELKKKTEDTSQSKDMVNCGSFDTNCITPYTPHLSAIPTDAYTGAPFTYTSTGDSYKLVYAVALPAYQKGSAIPYYGLYETDYGTKTTQRKIYLSFVNGQNTANPKVNSEEALASSKIDADGDGVADSLETYLGTDPKKKDTDGDGYSDYQEITTNSNPLGPGKLGNSSEQLYIPTIN